MHKTLAISQEQCAESQPLCKQKERREDKVQGGNPLFKCQAVRANPSLQLPFPLFCTSQGSDTPRPSLFRHLLYVPACGCDCARATTCIALHQWDRARRTYDSKKAAIGRDGGWLEKQLRSALPRFSYCGAARANFDLVTVKYESDNKKKLLQYSLYFWCNTRWKKKI